MNLNGKGSLNWLWLMCTFCRTQRSPPHSTIIYRNTKQQLETRTNVNKVVLSKNRNKTVLIDILQPLDDPLPLKLTHTIITQIIKSSMINMYITCGIEFEW